MCVSRSGQYAINLPAYSLMGVIQIDFKLHADPTPSASSFYFPSKEEDRFLAAITRVFSERTCVTVFGSETAQ